MPEGDTRALAVAISHVLADSRAARARHRRGARPRDHDLRRPADRGLVEALYKSVLGQDVPTPRRADDVRMEPLGVKSFVVLMHDTAVVDRAGRPMAGGSLPPIP